MPFAETTSLTLVGEPRTLAERRLVVCAALLYLLFLVYLRQFLQFELLRSDVLAYWSESLQWRTPFSRWFVPGYSLTIALVRAVTFNRLAPIVVMSLISFSFYLLSVVTVYRVARALDVKYACETALLFAAYPFVGLTYAVFPYADGMATALLLLTVLSLLERRWIRFTVFAGLALLAHKATWFFVPPLLAIAFVQYREARPAVPFAMLPIATWAVGGAIYYADALWMVRWSVEHLVVPRSSLLLLDGVLGPLLGGEIGGIVKGSIVLAVLGGAFLVLVSSWLVKFWVGLAISGAVLMICILINQYEIWAAVRYSKILLVPAASILGRQAPRWPVMIGTGPFAVIWVASLLSNVAYGYYTAHYYLP